MGPYLVHSRDPPHDHRNTITKNPLERSTRITPELPGLHPSNILQEVLRRFIVLGQPTDD